MPERQKFNKGVSIIELLVAILVIGVGTAALISLGTFLVRTSSLLKQTTQGSFLVQEGVEAVKNYRDNTEWTADDPQNEYDGLGVLALATPYHPALSEDTPPRWQLLAGQETLGAYTREIEFESAERDAQDDIVETGGNMDPDTKKVTVKVSWQDRGVARELVTTMFLTDWR